MCTGGGDKTLHDMAQGLEMMTRLRSHHNDLKNLERKNGLRTSGKRDVTLFQKPLKVNQSKLEEKQKRSMENMQKEKSLRASWKDRSLSIVAQTTQSRANS